MLDSNHLALIIIALITGVLSPVVIQLIRYHLFVKNKIKKCDVSNNLKNEDSITHKLEKIRDNFKADRVWICEFHNGGHTFSGKSLQKFSQTYEVVRRGVSKEGAYTQNLPTSLFSTFFNAMINLQGISINDVIIDESIVNISLRSFFDNRGVRSFAAAIIKNIEDNTIGVLCVDYVTQQKTFSMNDLVILKVDANIIAGYLENQTK